MSPKIRPHTVLITGGAGFIGSRLIRRFFLKYPDVHVICLDALTYAGNRKNLADIPKASRLIFVKGDITDAPLVRRVYKKYRPDLVINCAAETHVDRSIHGAADAFVRTNVLGTTVLLRALLDAPFVKKYVQVSTDEVYGSLTLASKKAFTESSPLAPNSPYAGSKAAGDLLARSFFKTYGLPIVITRCSNNYGPYQYPEKFIPFSIFRLMQSKPLTLYGDGNYIRDWIHVNDHADALILASGSGVPGEIYNIGASDEVSNLDLARSILTYFGKDESMLSFVADRLGHDRRYAIDSNKIRHDLGWKPSHSFRKSLPETIGWYVDNQRWVDDALKRNGLANQHIVSEDKDAV
ncbi:MAG TPA: dTDP-glucose 4,6-dehydratase [Candidatus Paceibacterota bacterium]|nr:dTDP-glucose 4,6-dehydratase [Candidatus Paceibacterota bacterium]